MPGKPQRKHIKTRTRADFTPFQQVIIGVCISIAILVPALVIYERSLAHLDHVNQEKIIWRCNGNGEGSCMPFAWA